MRVVRLLIARTGATTVQYRAQGLGGCSVRPRIGIETHRTPYRTLYVPSGAAVSCFLLLHLQIRSSRLGPSQPGELAAGRESKDQAPPFGESYTVRPAKVTQPSLVGGRAASVPPPHRRPSWNSTEYSGEPALTRDAGCRSASLVWTRAQLHYLTKRQHRNVDNETTYKTSAMKPPKRSGLAWSHGRDAALLRAVSSRSSTTLRADRTLSWGSVGSALACVSGRAIWGLKPQNGTGSLFT